MKFISHSQRFIKFLLALALGSIVMLPAVRVQAQEQQPLELAVGLRPENQSKGYFDYSMEPGQSMEDAVLAVNNTDQPMRLNVRVMRGTTGLKGGISLVSTGGVADWISLPDGNWVDIPAKAAVRLPFTVTVPAGTPPGEYVAGFLSTLPDEYFEFESVTVSAGSGAFIVKVVPQMGVAVVIRVGNPASSKVSINSIDLTTEMGAWKFSLGMFNQGNVHAKGFGAIYVAPAAGGEPVYKADFSMDYFVAGDYVNYPLYADPYLLKPGTYNVQVAFMNTVDRSSTQYSQQITIPDVDIETLAEDAPIALQKGTQPAGLELGRYIGFFSLGLIISILAVVFILRARK